jgi:hypothetical protein
MQRLNTGLDNPELIFQNALKCGTDKKMKTEKLIQFINKYSLNGMIEDAVWNYSNGTLSVTVMASNRKVFASASMKITGLPLPQELVIANNKLLIKTLRRMPEDIELSVSNDGYRLIFASGNVERDFRLAKKEDIDPVPTIKHLPEWKNTYNWDSEAINELIEKYKTAARADELITLANECEEAGVYAWSAKIIHAILFVNKDESKLVVKASQKGIFSIECPDGEMPAQYYVIKIELDDADEIGQTSVVIKAPTSAGENAKAEALKRYADKIIESVRESTESDKISTTHGKLSLASAIKAGDSMIAAKRIVGHGAWGRWIEDNCQITQATATNYMRLAKANSDDNELLIRVTSLKEAYVACGITQAATRDKQPSVPIKLSGVEYLTDSLSRHRFTVADAITFLIKQPVTDAQKLKPLVDRYNMLITPIPLEVAAVAAVAA